MMRSFLLVNHFRDGNNRREASPDAIVSRAGVISEYEVIQRVAYFEECGSEVARNIPIVGTKFSRQLPNRVHRFAGVFYSDAMRRLHPTRSSAAAERLLSYDWGEHLAMEKFICDRQDPYALIDSSRLGMNVGRGGAKISLGSRGNNINPNRVIGLSSYEEPVLYEFVLTC